MRATIDEIFCEDAEIYDPIFPVRITRTDHAYLIEYLRSNEPDNVVVYEDVREGHGWPWARARWRVIEPGSDDFTGIVVAELTDAGQISRLVSFSDRDFGATRATT